MKRFLTLSVLVAVALLSSTVLASGSKETPPMLLLEQPQPYTKWMKGLYVPLPPGEIRLKTGPRACSNPFFTGCMDWTRPPTVGMVEEDRETFVHELGHVFDMVVLAELGWRDKFALIDGSPWQTPRSEERFADAYTLCAFNRRLQKTIVTGIGWRATAEKHRAACALIREASRTLASMG